MARMISLIFFWPSSSVKTLSGRPFFPMVKLRSFSSSMSRWSASNSWWAKQMIRHTTLKCKCLGRQHLAPTIELTFGLVFSAPSLLLLQKAFTQPSLSPALIPVKNIFRNRSSPSTSRHLSGWRSMLRLSFPNAAASGCHSPPPTKDEPGSQCT